MRIPGFSVCKKEAFRRETERLNSTTIREGIVVGGTIS